MLAVLKETSAPIRITPKKVISTEKTFAQMVAKDDDELKFYSRIGAKQSKKGMDNFPLKIFNQLLDYMLSEGLYRDALFLVCMSNWGMRYSDVCRVRFGHIFDKDGHLKRSFSLPDGEKKTGKHNIYYNNAAISAMIELFLKHRRKSPYDFLFTSQSNNQKKISLKDMEANELYSHRIKLVEKNIKENKERQMNLLSLYTKGDINSEEFSEMNTDIRMKRSQLEEELSALNTRLQNYKSQTANADNIFIQQAMTRQAAENIIKDGLAAIGIFPRNRKNCCKEEMNLDRKFNTHSCRKTFSDLFVDKGTQLNKNGSLDIDTTVLKLLQDKLMHENMRTTNHYNQTEEKAFEEICMDMNIGLDIIKKYMEN